MKRGEIAGRHKAAQSIADAIRADLDAIDRALVLTTSDTTKASTKSHPLTPFSVGIMPFYSNEKGSNERRPKRAACMLEKAHLSLQNVCKRTHHEVAAIVEVPNAGIIF
tara:strand:+ start:498 stop:824 length:327 start_codon:yes stop_codon:yes gene_type:complete